MGCAVRWARSEPFLHTSIFFVRTLVRGVRCERCARSSVVCLHVQSVQTHKKMLFEYSSLVAYRVGPSTTVGVRSVTAENLRESAATAKTIRCKTERPTTRPRTTSIQLTGQAKARQCADLSGAGTAVPRRACRGLARAAMGKHRLGKSKVSRSTVHVVTCRGMSTLRHTTSHLDQLRSTR